MAKQELRCVSCGKKILVGSLCVSCARVVTNPGIRAAAAKGRKKK